MATTAGQPGRDTELFGRLLGLVDHWERMAGYHENDAKGDGVDAYYFMGRAQSRKDDAGQLRDILAEWEVCDWSHRPGSPNRERELRAERKANREAMVYAAENANG